MAFEAEAPSFSLSRLVRIAILIRVVLALFLHAFASEEMFAPDQVAYHALGNWLAQYWSGEVYIYPPRLLQAGPTGYYYVVAVLYSLTGAFSLVPKIVNAVLGGLAVGLVYDVARRMTGSLAAAARAATFTAYFPSLILWSILNIRDCWVIFLILLICREALVVQERVNPRSLLLLAAAVLSVTQFRDYIF